MLISSSLSVSTAEDYPFRILHLESLVSSLHSSHETACQLFQSFGDHDVLKRGTVGRGWMVLILSGLLALKLLRLLQRMQKKAMSQTLSHILSFCYTCTQLIDFYQEMSCQDVWKGRSTRAW